MARQPGKIRYSNSNCIQDIVGFICNCILSYNNTGQELIIDAHNDHDQAEEPQKIHSLPIALVYTLIFVDSPIRHKSHASSPPMVEILVNHKPLALPPISAKIPDRYKPLDLPPIIHDFPANYNNKMPRFDGENVNITAEKHIQRFEDFLELYEVEYDDVYIRMFALSLQGKVKKWFKNLPAASIKNFHQFMQIFLDRWVIMRNVFLILEEYDHLKRHPRETVQ
jgi:hypothetical protein